MGLKRCECCKVDQPDTAFTKANGGRRCRTCQREAQRRHRARKRDRKYIMRSAYEVSPPKDFPQFGELLQENMRALADSLKLWAGVNDVIVPMDRFPQTGVYVDDRLKLEAGPGTEPSWVINLDGVRGRIRLSDKPLHLFAAWLTERYAVLGEPRLEEESL